MTHAVNGSESLSVGNGMMQSNDKILRLRFTESPEQILCNLFPNTHSGPCTTLSSYESQTFSIFLSLHFTEQRFFSTSLHSFQSSSWLTSSSSSSSTMNLVSILSSTDIKIILKCLNLFCLSLYGFFSYFPFTFSSDGLGSVDWLPAISVVVMASTWVNVLIPPVFYAVLFCTSTGLIPNHSLPSLPQYHNLQNFMFRRA